MSKRTIKFTMSLPERTSDTCPKCGMTDTREDEIRKESYDKFVETLECGDDWHFDEKDVELPAVWDICQRCKGEGQHSNPSIDGNGITSEEWFGPDWDDESREAYMNGEYDVACEAGCTGGKVLVPDEDACKNEPLKSLLEAYEKQQDERRRDDYADRRMRYMESGGREGGW